MSNAFSAFNIMDLQEKVFNLVIREGKGIKKAFQTRMG